MATIPYTARLEVADDDEFTNALASESYDVVLSDPQEPPFDQENGEEESQWRSDVQDARAYAREAIDAGMLSAASIAATEKLLGEGPYVVEILGLASNDRAGVADVGAADHITIQIRTDRRSTPDEPSILNLPPEEQVTELASRLERQKDDLGREIEELRARLAELTEKPE